MAPRPIPPIPGRRDRPFLRLADGQMLKVESCTLCGALVLEPVLHASWHTQLPTGGLS